MGRVDGKVVLISGGARGMGAEHARALVDEGASVVLGDVLDEEGSAVAAEIGTAARYVHLDVTDPDDWDRAVTVAVESFGSLTGLVNNAGIVNGAPLSEFPLTDWHHIIGVNLTGTFLGMRAATPHLIASGDGSIVNISSIEGMQGSPFIHGYVASKWGVRGLTKSAALELAETGVRVNSVHPGLIRTPMTEGITADQLPIPMKREAEPSEVATFIVFLMSDESSYATGAEFTMDGGLTAGAIVPPPAVVTSTTATDL